MLCLSGFDLYSCWVPLKRMYRFCAKQYVRLYSAIGKNTSTHVTVNTLLILCFIAFISKQ